MCSFLNKTRLSMVLLNNTYIKLSHPVLFHVVFITVCLENSLRLGIGLLCLKMVSTLTRPKQSDASQSICRTS